MERKNINIMRWGGGIHFINIPLAIFSSFYRGLGLVEALLMLKKKRDIKPNPGFLEQLIRLEIEQKQIE